MDNFPDEVYAAILLKASSVDCSNFFLLRRVCRRFLLVPRDYICSRVSLRNMRSNSWNFNKRLHDHWLNCCIAAHNLEAWLYIGLLAFRNPLEDPYKWFACLVHLKDGGYLPGAYALGLMHLFFGENEIGFESLRPLLSMSMESPSQFISCISEYRDQCLAVLEDDYNHPWYRLHKPVEDPWALVCSCAPGCQGSTSDQSWRPMENLCTCYETCFFKHESALLFRRNARLRK